MKQEDLERGNSRIKLIDKQKKLIKNCEIILDRVSHGLKIIKYDELDLASSSDLFKNYVSAQLAYNETELVKLVKEFGK